MSTGLNTMACRKFGLHLAATILVLSLGGGCATSLLDCPATSGETVEGKGTIVGSFLIEPVPQWSNYPKDFWLLVMRWGSVKQYSIPLQPSQEEYVMKHLPAGRYRITEVYAGKPGNRSRGHGRKGTIRPEVEFGVHEQQITYIGRLRLTVAKELDQIRAWRQSTENRMRSTVELLSGLPMNTAFAQPIARPKMYVKTTVEESSQEAIELLERKGWKQTDMDRIVTSLMGAPSPSKK